MSANLFEENKTNEKDNPIIQIMNKPEDDNESNINNQEKQNSIFNNSMIMKKINELIDKISKIGYSSNKKGGLIGNSTSQENKETYSPYEDTTSDNIINSLEYNKNNDENENNLVKIMEEIENGENINISTIRNQEEQNSIFTNSIINIYN